MKLLEYFIPPGLQKKKNRKKRELQSRFPSVTGKEAEDV